MPRAAWLALCSSSIADEMTRPNEMPVTPCSTIRIMTSTKEPSLGIYKRERQREGARRVRKDNRQSYYLWQSCSGPKSGIKNEWDKKCLTFAESYALFSTKSPDSLKESCNSKGFWVRRDILEFCNTVTAIYKSFLIFSWIRHSFAINKVVKCQFVAALLYQPVCFLLPANTQQLFEHNISTDLTSFTTFYWR